MELEAVWGRKVLMAPQWTEEVHWGNAEVPIRLTCDEVRDVSPAVPLPR